MNLSVAAGKEFAGFIGNVDFGKQRSRSRVNGFGGTNDFAFYLAARKLSEFKSSDHAAPDGGCGALRNVHVNADWIGLRQRKELLRRAAVAGVDERASIHIAASDHATERRINMFEGFEFLEAMNVGQR